MYYPQFISTLLITSKISSVLIPPSLQSEKQYYTAPYSSTCPLLHKFVTFPWQTDLLNKKSKANKHKLIEANTLSAAWSEHEQQWRNIPYSEATFDNSFYAMIVTLDMEMIRNYYLTMEGTHILDPLHDELEKVLDVCLSPPYVVPEKEGQKRQCLVVLNAHLLSEKRQKFIVSRCSAVKVRVATVTSKYNPENKTVKVVSSNHHERQLEVFFFQFFDSFPCLT